MRQRWNALVAGVELGSVTLLGPLASCFIFASLVPGLGLGMVFLVPFPMLLSRRVCDLARRRTERRTGLAIARPYTPAPPPPLRQPDGWYRRDRQLYRRPWVPRFLDQLEWVMGDNATWRDLGWLTIGPFTGGLVALLPMLLIVVPTAAGLPLWAGIPIAVLGWWIAPFTTHAAARFNRWMLGPQRGPQQCSQRPSKVDHAAREWFARNAFPVCKLAVLLLTSVLAGVAFVATVLGLALAYVLGLFFLVGPVIEDLRPLATWRRSLAPWSGLGVIPEPYRPLPPLHRHSEHGLYQVGKALYKSRRWAEWANRRRWALHDPATWREVLWRGLDPLVGGAIAGPPVLMVGLGVWGPLVTRHYALLPVGLVAAWAGMKLAPLAVRWHGRWSRVLLGPTAQTVLAQRVEQLTVSRAEASETSASELRRIERDLHDGAQARLIAVGMSLATIERLLDTDPAAARELLGSARESAATALRELREVVRGIHPPVLAERGLGDAVRAMALDGPLSAHVSVTLPARLPEPIEAAAYFAVAEALGNAARHAQATRVDITLAHDGEALRIVVRDNGRGGADPDNGSGLRGLARRLGIFDGIVTVSSPPGGPTELTMEIPCASSSPRTSTSSGRG